MNVSIICPLYNAEKYLLNLHKSILKQENIGIESINYVLTESEDNTEKVLNQMQFTYVKISKNEFSHSLTREKVALKSKGDIIVFITQDILIEDKFWLINLVQGILNGECEAAFSRQIAKDNGIEKYIRCINYPEQSRIVSKNHVNIYGLNTFFFSDVSSAIRADVFRNLSGYDGKNLITNEDMYFAHKLIMNGFNIKYCAESIVLHSHRYSFKQLFKRYYDTGVFFAQNRYFQAYNTNKSGFNLVKFVLKNSFENKDIKTFLSVIINFGVRFIGMKLGKRYNKFSKKINITLSSNKFYWENGEG